jgi:hypothetical protein
LRVVIMYLKERIGERWLWIMYERGERQKGKA